MGGGSIVGDDGELASQSSAMSTMVLLGKTGNGKSATGNTLLGKRAFISRPDAAGVTHVCEKHSTTLNDGRTLNVIDTPGLFDSSYSLEPVGKEIVRCMDLAKDGIHAVLVVFSVRNRFSKEEEATIKTLQTLFSDKITDYTIVVFTGGDDLEDDGMTLEDYIGQKCPEPLQDILKLCKYRAVLFDNKTKDATKRVDQVHDLLSLVDRVIVDNGRQPFSDQFFADLKEGELRLHDIEVEIKTLKEIKGYTEEDISDLKNQIHKSYEDQLAKMTAKVVQKLEESVELLKRQLANEQAAREKAVKTAEEAQMKSSSEISQLRESWQRAQKESEELRRRLEVEGGKCAIQPRESWQRAQKESEELRRRLEGGKCAIL